jgi:hypothetical protein
VLTAQSPDDAVIAEGTRGHGRIRIVRPGRDQSIRLPGGPAEVVWSEDPARTLVLRRADGHPAEQAVPLSANALGLAVLPVWVAWNPNETEAPGAMEPL